MSQVLLGWHRKAIRAPRSERLVDAIVELVPGAPSSLVDIGCGDGRISRGVAERWGCEVSGFDVAVHPHPVIHVEPVVNGRLALPDGQADAVLLCDMLHHASDPRSVLREALRVLRCDGYLVIKDHVAFGPISRGVLLAMDLVGNAQDRVTVRGGYWSRGQWHDVIREIGGELDRVIWPLRVHDLPWRLVARSEYQILMLVRHARCTT